MAGQQGGGGQQSDNSMGFLWIIIAVFAGGLLVWYVYHAQIVSGIFAIKLGEIYLVSFFTDALEPTRNLIKSFDPGSVSFLEVASVSTQVGNYLKIPIALVLAILAFIMFRGSPVTRFKKTYSMGRLHHQEAENWPYIAPVRGLNLLEKSIDEGEWAMAMAPMAFARKYKLLKVVMPAAAEGKLISSIKPKATIIPHKANAVFLRQMGRPWMGVEKLPKHAQALFAAFAAKAEGDRQASMNLLRQIAASGVSGSKKLNFSGTDALLKKHLKSKLIQKVISRHAYEYTVMASVLEVARTDGVIASAEFIWLKPLDRPLWYVLNTVGRQTCPTEIAGSFAHWLVEKEMNRPLTVPMIEQATKGLELAIGDVIYVPTEGEVIE